MKLTVRDAEAKGKLKRAFKLSMQALSVEATKQITSSDWDSGQDLVDTGQLRAAQTLRFLQVYVAVLLWPVQHAAPVFLGATLRNGTTIAARNAPRRALDKWRADDTFGRIARGLLG